MQIIIIWEALNICTFSGPPETLCNNLREKKGNVEKNPNNSEDQIELESTEIGSQPFKG